MTEGRVRLVAKLDVRDRDGNPLCVFTCEGTSPEGSADLVHGTHGGHG